MAGEAKRTYATKELDAENNQEEKKLASEQFNEKVSKGSPEHFQNVCVESQTVNNNTKFVEKEKDNTQQREAVIRPQQAGKIDFKSLQNRSNFASDRTWPNGKVSPQSPSGKSRIRDKGKKSGKSESAKPQQLCRLSTTNSRSNPTIGIAYPQQKLSPPKKLEASRGPVSGSYRFHVPNIPEREAELQQEEFNLNRFQEGSNLISPNYTSQVVGSAAGGSSHQHPATTAPQQQPGALENNNTQPVNQMLFPDFQLSGADMWQSPDRAFSNASFGVPSQKSNNVVEVNKPNSFVPLPFQYGYPLLDNADSFPCDQNPQPQDLIEASLGSNQVIQNSFSFQTSGEEHEVVQSNAKLSYEQSEDRQYSLHSKPPQYVQTSHAIPSSVHCTRNIDSTSPASSSSDDSQKASPSQFYNQAQKKSKENIVSFSPNIRHGKSNVESGKGCLDSYGMEQRPPPPYSAHQLLASSLATANLDQLDVLLTCKQCDQNFNNLASFLDHKQYCGQHTFAQNDFKDIRKVEDTRKFHADHTKAISSDDPMKLMLPSAPLPDLEMEDAKLDNDEITTTKCSSSRQTLKTKDSVMLESRKNNQASDAHNEGTREETSLVKRESTLEESNTRTEWVKEPQKSDKTADERELGPRSSTPQKLIVKERKRKRISGGSWSKELIHKIVQQKNKLHKLNVKGTKNMQFSLVMERVTPTVQNPTFREYDYISDSDEDFGGFDNNLYPDIQLTKEGFSPMETAADKKELFESSFSPLLEQRDWSLMVDVTPELPDEIAQYKEDSDIANDKKTCFNPVPFTMTEKIMDYHPNLNACVSDDELEIKRIVTELESQLQSAKLSSPSPLDNEPPKHLTMSKFSPLRLDDHEAESDQRSMEVVCPSESLGLAAPTDSHSELFSEPDLPWSSPVQFGLMSGQQCLHTPTHSTVTDTPIHLCPETLHVKGGTELNILSAEKPAELSNEDKSESSDPLGTATNKSEEMIEQEIYTENLKKSLEVISDSLSSGLESAQSSVQQTECSKEQEKEKDDKTEKTGFPNESEKVDSRYTVAELTGCSSDLNKTLEEPPKLISAETDNTTAKPEICASLNALENNGQANDTISGEYLGIKEICDPCEDSSVAIKSETMSYPTDESGSHCEGYTDPPISPSGLGTDLKDLFDDENTFSQLFPRNDEMKRKKCARVYGKSSKKQKQMLSLVSDYNGSNTFSDNNEEFMKKPDNVFASSLEEHCEYETISLDDAKMLEMCHKSTLKSSPQKSFSQDVTTDHQVGHEDTQEARVSDFLCHTEDAILQPAVNLNGSEDRNIDTRSDAKENCKSDEPCPLQLVCVQDDVPQYPSIDIQNFNTTFQLPEMSLFESERDMSVVEAIVPKKSLKKPTQCRNRKRIETGLKPKDKQYKCKVCFTWFLTLGELDFHKLSHNPSPPPTCYMCVQRKFSSREQLRDHLREKHVKNKAGVWTCGMCLKEISDVWMYNEHLREHATQFARKGQSQSSLLDMPGCFMQENAVKNFISSIMQHQSKKSIKGENAKSSKEERKASTDVSGVDQKSSDTCEPETIKSKVGSAGGGSKHSIFTPLEVLPKADTTPKNVEMHPNCKDPSRDCHHCGKQFPKPFKLQRHLVVHNLQKIFMCHKCPVSYQQAKELKDHLKSEHEEVDEPDSKHTTLYTCELCADVMHVIKKSFICSTCNYTFSKKEQFDRHMEKHLAGGSKIFKFRGVVRPCKSKEDEFDMPANKKRKILPENSQENSLNISSLPSVHLQRSTDIQGLKPATDNSCNSTDEDKPPTDTNNTSVKIEDVVEDLSGALEVVAQHQSQMTSAENTLNTKTMTKEEDNEDLHMTHTHDIPDTDTKEVGTEYKASLNEICDVKVEDDCGATQTTSKMPIPNESNVPDNKMKESTDLFNADEKETNLDLCSLQFPNQTSKSMHSSQTEDLLPNVIRLPSLSNVINQLRQDQINEGASTGNENEQVINNNDQSICVLAKERTSVKSEENIKQCLDKSESMGVTDAAGVNQAKISLSSVIAEDKDCVKLKKRKDLKTLPSLPRTASTVTRENLGIDPKVKKKFRSNKCERVAGQRKGDISADYPVLTSVKDEMTSNKIVSKHKTGTLDLQPKRGSDNFSPKKEELARHLNWDCRGKKGVPGRAIHSATSKVSVTSLSNSFNKSRPKLGVKSVETQSYHTAESHNSLLSKLFGQRLTGFKIPLRKDTSESIN
ncbi:hypothetical protein QTP86_003287 [Hemibagrus guttatus]|nr:hypothetical protein QTP86_003287 [Hemibagrus guttatus]